MSRYAIIDQNNVAVNFIVWDGVSPYDPGEGLTLIQMNEDVQYNWGWIYDPATGTFTDPNSPAPEPTP